MEEKSLLVDVDEAARLLNISRTLARRLIREGVIPTVRLGDRVLIARAALEAIAAGGGSK